STSAASVQPVAAAPAMKGGDDDDASWFFDDDEPTVDVLPPSAHFITDTIAAATASIAAESSELAGFLRHLGSGLHHGQAVAMEAAAAVTQRLLQAEGIANLQELRRALNDSSTPDDDA